MNIEKITVVIPVYNDGENIIKTLTAIKNEMKSEYKIITVYDCDQDTTLSALDEAKKSLNIKTTKLRNKYGRGVLNAIRTGLEAADSEYVIVTMADLSDPPAVMNDMIETADREQADIVCASRYMRGGRQIGGPFLKGLMSRCAGLSLHALAGLPIHDPTNSFKLYRKSFLDKMTIESSDGFELGIELVIKAWKQGYKIVEVPTVWSDRTNVNSNFKLWKWLSNYLHWYFTALFGGQKQKIDREGISRFGGIILFLLFLITHIPAVAIFDKLETWVPLLHLAHKFGLKFGHDLIFPYGPLGYLLFPFYHQQLLISSIFSFALLLPFVIFFIRKLSLIDLFFLLAFTIISTNCTAYEVFSYLLPMLIWRVSEERKPYIKYGGVVYISILAAGCVFVKFMGAPVILFSLLLSDIQLIKQKKLILATPIFLLSIPLIWCACAQQDIAHLYHFFIYSWHIAAGYNYSMFLSESSPLWIFILAGGAVLILGITLWADKKREDYKSSLEKILYSMLLIPNLFVIYKYGVVRADVHHIGFSMQYLSLMAVFCSAYFSMYRKWRFSLFLLSLLLLFLSTWVQGINVRCIENAPVISAVFSAALLIYILIKHDFFSRLSRLILFPFLCIVFGLSMYGIFLPWTTDCKSYSVNEQKTLFCASDINMWPVTTADYFSFHISSSVRGVKYHPRFVIQSYSAYTPELLKKNASHFEYETAPDRIFYGRQSIDFILPSFHDSSALLHIINNYNAVPHKQQLRKKNTRPPLAHLTKIKTCHGEFNKIIALPHREKFLWMSIDFKNTLMGNLLKYVCRPPEVRIRLVLDNGKTVTHKIIPENSVVPFLISPYMAEWDQLNLLLSKGNIQLPKVVSFSIHPVFRCFAHYFDLKHWDQKIGELSFSSKIAVHFYQVHSFTVKGEKKL